MKRKIILVFAAIFIIFGMIIISSAAENQRMLGDVDGNGRIALQDARTTLRTAVKIDVLPVGESFWAADVNKDKSITGSDARIILRAAVKIETLPEEYYSESPAGKTYILVEELIPPEPVPVTDSQNTTTTAPATSSPQGNTHTPTGSYPSGDVNYPIPAMPEYDKSSGTFAFISYGWGHGVGFSQYGAVYLAEQCNCDYLSILGYYYRGGVTLAGETPPESVLMGDGTYVNTVEILARVTQQEIGGITYNKEALKAQVVLAYTNIIKYGYTVKNLAYTKDMSRVREDVIQAVYDVYGQHLMYNGQTLSAVFGAMSSGITADPQYVWGGNYPYLAPVSSPFDRLSKNYLTVKTFTTDEIRSIIDSFNAKIRAGKISYCGEIDLSDDPSTWFEILAHDASVSSNVGYVTSMRIGNQIIADRAGQRLRESVFDYEIRSHCLIIEYYP